MQRAAQPRNAAEGRDLTQRELVDQAMHGSHAAFAELAATAIGRLYGIAGQILRNPAQAEDAVQNALIRAWRDLPRLRDAGRFDAWLRRLLVNACHDELRRSSRYRSDVTLGDFDGAMPDVSASLAARDEIAQGFARLTDEYRTVLALRFYLDLSLAEIAQALDLPIGTVKSRLSRASRALHAELAAASRAATEGQQA
jgi:RNA polymerase sigma-70 factor (ECF subfamily)